jgi:hypothetical protein
LKTGLLLVAASVVITGCEYDGPTALYYQQREATGTPLITALDPAEAAPGFNHITIRGQNFAAGVENNKVYFDGTEAEVVDVSATSLTVRRPNLVGDSTMAKVVAYGALAFAKYGPYRIASVVGKYGSFLNNLPLSAIAVDKADTVYVIETVSKNIVKIAPDGQQTVIGVAARVPTDARIGPGGKLYLMSTNRSIEAFDPQTGQGKEWRRCPSGKNVRFGDFDANGYFYTGGAATDLVIIAPDSTFRTAGVYTGSTQILAVRVYNGYVYVASRPNAQSPATISRHMFDGQGNLGSQEMVVDLTAAGFGSRTLRALTFSANGTMYIGTDAPDPILVAPQSGATGEVDTFYKSILPSYCKQFYWGTGNYLYMIRGDTALGEEWTVYRIDLGTPGAPYYGS